MYFLGTCKLSIAILGNSLIMSALLFYKLVTRVCLFFRYISERPLSDQSSEQT